MAITPGFFGIDEPTIIDKRADTNTMTRSATAVHREVVSIGSPNDATPEQIAEVTSGLGLHINLRDVSGTEIATAGDPLRVDPTGSTTQPVSGTVTANAGTGDFLSIAAHTINEVLKEAMAVGGQFDDAATTVATEDNVASVRITAQRAFHINLRNVAGAEIGISATPIRTDPTGTTTQPVSGTVTADAGTGFPSVATDAGAHGASQTGIRAMGTDGTNDQQIAVDATGNVQVDIVADAAGLALAGNQLAAGHDVTVDNVAGTNPVPVEGDEAHDAPATSQPVLVAGFAEEDAPTEVSADGDVVNAWYSRKGQQVVVQEHPPQLVAAATHGPLTLTKSTTAIADLVGAPGASTSIYVTQLSASNTSSTFVRLDTSDGATVRDSMGLAADGGGYTKHFSPAWKLAANAALRVTLSAAVTDVRINVHYYTAPT